jgi:hypothetical protein
LLKTKSELEEKRRL